MAYAYVFSIERSQSQKLSAISAIIIYVVPYYATL